MYLIQNEKGSFLIDRTKTKKGWWARFEIPAEPILMKFRKKEAAEFTKNKLTNVRIVDILEANKIINERYLKAKKEVEQKCNESELGKLLQLKLQELDPLDLGQE